MANFQVLVFALSLLFLFGYSSADTAFIESLCDRCSHTARCLKELESDGRATTCGDKACVAHVGVEHALGYATNIQAQAQGILDSHPPPPADITKEVNDCLANYKNIIGLINDSLSLLDKSQNEDSGKVLENATLQTARCTKQLDESTALFSEILDLATELVELLDDFKISF